MNIFTSSLFGSVPEPECFEDLMNLVIAGYDSEDSRNVRFWRGQSDINWPIDSGAYRKLKISGEYKYYNDIEKRICSLEERLLKLARHKGFGEEFGKTISDVELLAKLQHHGAATRLVDFSKNALIALWFCAQALPDKTGMLLGLHTNCLGGSGEGTYSDTNYKELTANLKKYDNPFFIETPSVSKRISSQHGVFVYSSYTDSPTGSLKLSNDDKDVLCIAISPELKMRVLQILRETFDIRAVTLFPDLDGFGIANGVFSIEEAYRW